jgi:amino acid efflux transporter
MINSSIVGQGQIIAHHRARGAQVSSNCPGIRGTLPPMLSTRTAIALYVGAVLGPGVLILPALAAEAAGPASVLAWMALLALSAPLAITFAALGVRQPEAGGTAAYARAAFGPRTGGVTGWWFLAGVVLGAPAVALIGGFYVAELVDAGREGAVAAAAGMMAAVMAANAVGLRTSARLQLGLAGLLAALLLVAVVSALPESRAEHWAPFAPHGWAAIGTAASLLMLSFIGWEAVSHLAGELRDPARQLPRAIFAALGVVVVLYLGLAVATVGVLGTSTPSDVPLADLMAAGLGPTGRTATAALAVLLTMGTMNAYVAAAIKLAGALAEEGSAPAALARPGRALALFAVVAALLLAPLGADLLSLEGLVQACSAAFVAVYVTATAAGVRLLAGAARVSAGVALAAVVVVLAFFGPYLLVPALVAVAALFPYRRAAITPASRSTAVSSSCAAR